MLRHNGSLDKKKIAADRVIRVEFDGKKYLNWPNVGRYFHHENQDGQYLNAIVFVVNQNASPQFS